jgi:hypothetical protein
LLNALGPASNGPNFQLAASPATLNITQGQSKITTITLTPENGFTGTVNLTATVLGQVAGVTAILSQSTVTPSGPSPTLTVSTASSTPGGNFQIVVTGTSGGLTHFVYITLALPGFTPQSFPGESVAVAMQYRDISDGSQDDRTFNLYAYKFVLNRSKAVESFSLSSNRDVIVLAATLTEDRDPR